MDIFPDPKSSSPQSRVYGDKPFGSPQGGSQEGHDAREIKRALFYATTNCAWLRLKIRTSVHT